MRLSSRVLISLGLTRQPGQRALSVATLRSVQSENEQNVVYGVLVDAGCNSQVSSEEAAWLTTEGQLDGPGRPTSTHDPDPERHD
jgi:hypothetical protein